MLSHLAATVQRCYKNFDKTKSAGKIHYSNQSIFKCGPTTFSAKKLCKAVLLLIRIMKDEYYKSQFEGKKIINWKLYGKLSEK